LAARLMSSLSAAETKDWVWFEALLAYDNARLPQSLIRTGSAIQSSDYIEAGLRALRWLTKLQTASLGHFRPVGTRSFGAIRRKPEAFDQQPVEAAATISACFAAWQADGGAEWHQYAAQAFAWFLGENDLRTSLIDPETGGCLDGLHPDRPNENRGAESTLSYLLGLLDMKQFTRTGAVDQTRSVSRLIRSTVGTLAPQVISGDFIASIPIPESAGPISAAGSGKSRRETVQTGD
jgi:hypothetical protein